MQQPEENQEFNWDNVWESDNNQENVTPESPTENNDDWNWESTLEEDMGQEQTPVENTESIENEEWNWEDSELTQATEEPVKEPTGEPEVENPKIDPLTNQLEDAHLPFVSEVEEFNNLFNKPNNYTPNVASEKDWKFVYDFIKEELEEYKEACEQKDIIGILDALCDIAYVSLGNGTMLHGLKTKIWPAYSEVQRSNLSKACKTAQEAIDTLKQRTKEQEEPCHVEQFGDMYIVYRTRDRKVMKNIYFTEPDLYQFFSQEELNKSTTPVKFNVNDLKEVNIDTLSEKAENEDNTFTNTNEEDTW